MADVSCRSGLCNSSGAGAGTFLVGEPKCAPLSDDKGVPNYCKKGLEGTRKTAPLSESL